MTPRARELFLLHKINTEEHCRKVRDAITNKSLPAADYTAMLQYIAILDRMVISLNDLIDENL